MKHGCIPSAMARPAPSVWNFPDPVPVHREPIYTRVPTSSRSIRRTTTRRPSADADAVQDSREGVEDKVAKQFPLILTSGRLVEYEGGGEETRSNKWLAELQQDKFVEINPADATERGITDGGWVWVESPTKFEERASRRW